MKLNKGSLLRACKSKWRKMERRALPCLSSTNGGECDELFCLWPLLHQLQKLSSSKSSSKKSNDKIPKDVPKGHMVVYVGQNLNRYVIKISLLNHPLFRALLDQARDELGFTTNSKLWIPCEENMFLDVVRCASSSWDGALSLTQSRLQKSTVVMSITEAGKELIWMRTFLTELGVEQEKFPLHIESECGPPCQEFRLPFSNQIQRRYHWFREGRR